MRRLALAGALVACTNNDVTVVPIIDSPLNDSASAFPLDSIVVDVTDGTTTVQSQTFNRGQAIELTGVPFSSNLVVQMTGKIGTSDVAYGRTCSFAVAEGQVPPSPHLFFSRETQFGQLATPHLPALRRGGTGLTFHDGSGVLIGGVDPNDAIPVDDVEHFDPRIGDFVPSAQLSSQDAVQGPRTGAVAALFTSAANEVALIGGTYGSPPQSVTTIKLVDFDDSLNKQIQDVDDPHPLDYNEGRIGLTATTLSDGNVLVIGGQRPDGTVVDEIDLLSEANRLFGVDRVANSAPLSFARWNHTATRLGDGYNAPVVIIGGIDQTGMPVANAELYKPEGGISTAFTATMIVPRSQHTTVRLPDDSLLIFGGIDKTGTPVATIERFTLDGGFQLAYEPLTTPPAPAQLPDGVAHTDLTATLLTKPNTNDATVLVTGGRIAPVASDTDGVAAAYELDFGSAEGSINYRPLSVPLSGPRWGHQATLMCNGLVLISGGTKGQVPAEVYNPGSSSNQM